MKYLLLILLLVSCSGSPEPVEEVFDSSLVKPLHDSVAKILPVVEKVIIRKENQIVYRIKETEKLVEKLKQENIELKEQTKIVKTVIQRDTIYIKEKTNFWGKKRVSADSSTSVDSTIIEQ